MPIDVTENYIRIRVEDPAKFQEDSFRIIWISKKDKIKAVAGRLNGKTSLTVQSLLFDKEIWTVERAKAWVKEHGYTIKQEDDALDISLSVIPNDSELGIIDTKAITTTDYFLRDGLSKYAPDAVIYKSLPFSIRAEEALGDGSIPIEGWASTRAIDMMNDIIEPSAFASSITEWVKRGTMLFMHDWYGIPIGRFDSAEIRPEGLWVQGRILPTSDGKDVSLLVQHGVLDALSVGFRALKWSIDDVTKIRTIHDLKLYEVSVVNAGANPQAIFTQAKNLEITLKSLTPISGGEGGQQKEVNVPQLDSDALKTIHTVEKMVGDFGVSLETVSTDVGSLKAKFDEQGKLFKTLAEKQEQLHSGIVTTADFKQGTERLGADILDLKKDMQTIRQARQVKDERIEYTDWKMMPSDLIFCYDDQGRERPAIYQKAYRLFHVPVDYMGYEGALLKNLRNLHDTLVILDAYYRNPVNGKGRYRITDLKTWRLFNELLGIVDPDFAKALSTGVAGSGSEWIPEEMSAELQALYRLVPNLESYFPSFEMATSSVPWPIQTSGAKLYRASQAAVANPTELVKSSMGTSKITFTVETYATVVPLSEQFLEDAVVAIVPVISNELAYSAANGFEGLLVNGDSTATHFDTGAGYTSIDPETYEKGLRRHAYDLSKTFDTQSATAGIGDGTTAFAAEDVRYGRKLCGKMGKSAREGLFIFSVAGWFKALNFTQVATMEKFGDRASWLTGDLEAIDGAQIYVSDQVREDLAATGVYTGSGATTLFLYCNKRGFRVGNRRGMTIEFEKNILTQQWAFVGSMRKSFQKMTPSTLFPVAYGYNITS